MIKSQEQEIEEISDQISKDLVEILGDSDEECQ